jgi:hypothetical protein
MRVSSILNQEGFQFKLVRELGQKRCQMHSIGLDTGHQNTDIFTQNEIYLLPIQAPSRITILARPAFAYMSFPHFRNRPSLVFICARLAFSFLLVLPLHTVYSPLSGCAGFPAFIVTCGVKSLIGWISHTKPPVRRRLR